MGNMTDKFTTLEEQLASQHTDVMEALGLIEDKLDLANSSLDLIINNNALNTRLIIAAIGQGCYCEPGSTPPIVTPPTDPTTRPVNQDKCKRVQAFLHTMQEVFTVLDITSAVGVGFTPNLIIDAFNQVIAELGNTDETGLISFPEAVQLAGALINYTLSNVFVGGTLSGYFAPLVLDLRDAMYSPTTPAATQAAYNGVIAGSSVPSAAQSVIIDAAYNALWSYYFDPDSTPNLTGYDGMACAGAECITMTSVADSLSCGATLGIIPWDSFFEAGSDDGRGCTGSGPFWATTDLIGWSFTPTANVRFFHNDASYIDITANTTHIETSHTSHAAIVYLSGEVPFTVEVCDT